VNEIPPLCGEINGKIVMITNNTINLELTDIYYNWMVIGNVIANIKLSIDGIHLNRHSFAGFYLISLHGTENTNGSGYYKA
jgi:nitric oxide synthase oxygenase domain/subunit